MEHVDDPDSPYGAYIKKPCDSQADAKEGGGEKHRVRKQHKGKTIFQPIFCKEHCGDKLRTEHAKEDARKNTDSAQHKGLRKEEPGNGVLFHSKDGLDSKFLLSVTEHIIVYKADQEQEQQTDGAYSQLHAVAQNGKIILRSHIRAVIPAGDGQKGIQEHGADGHCDHIDQVISGGTSHVPDNQLKIHLSVLLPAW